MSARWNAGVPCCSALAFFVFLQLSLGLCVSLTAQQLPLDYEQRFDQVVLTAAHDGVAIPVFPLRRPPNKDQPLRVRVLDYPDRQYDVAWSDIERIEYF